MNTDNYIYFNDLHYGATPNCRKDDYNSAILKKLEYVLKLARKNDCVVLFGGDFFDTPKIKYLDLSPLIKVLTNYMDVKIYAVHGNEGHDGLVDSSPLTIFKMLGMIKMKDFVDFEHSRVLFCNHGQRMEDVEKNSANNKINIMLTHETIVASPVIFKHTLMKDIHSKCQIITVAHFHSYQGHIQENGIHFLAPGSISRRKRTKEEITKTPKCYHIQIGPNKIDKIQEIDIPYEKDVWIDRPEFELENDQIYEEILANVHSMREVLTSQEISMDLMDSIELYGQQINMENQVIEYTKGRLKNG
jgi:DNA repair exonuclease SbcCD nuclease subunit